ncbi:hypothetical protein GCM10009802_40850 [Streptomyces synnematoformans]|uniref:Uncharacterized protein n=1 Tax=Streptomyces synnematoformans TaxID=415721 RepID=A0ABP5KI74_9ACTN
MQLQDGDGRLLWEVPVDHWLPESPVLFDRHAEGAALLARTGLGALLKSCGLPLRTVTDPEDPLLDRTTRRRARQLGPGHRCRTGTCTRAGSRSRCGHSRWSR